MIYTQKTEDPWFSATSARVLSWSDGMGTSRNPKGQEIFLADEPLGVLGCTTSRYHCHPDLPTTTGCVKVHAKDAEDRIAELWPNQEDQALIRVWILALRPFQAGNLGSFFLSNSLPSLLARRTILGDIQSDALASDHWKREFEYLFQATLALMQSRAVEYARGYWVGGPFCGPDTDCRRMCHSQVCLPHLVRHVLD